jgi:hypothetical protein
LFFEPAALFLLALMLLNEFFLAAWGKRFEGKALIIARTDGRHGTFWDDTVEE